MNRRHEPQWHRVSGGMASVAVSANSAHPPPFNPPLAASAQNATSLMEAAQILNREIWKIWGIYFKPVSTL